MTKKWFLILMVVFFVFQGVVLTAADNPADKEIQKKIQKAMKSADSALNDKKFDKAIEGYNEVLQLSPEHGPAFFGLGRAQAALQKNEEAITNLEKAIKLDPNATPDMKKFFINTIINTIRTLASSGKNNMLSPYYIKIVEIPGIETINEQLYVESLTQIGYSFFASREIEKAIEYYKKLEAYPNALTNPAYKKYYFQAIFQIAYGYSQLGKGKEAVEYFSKLIQNPDAQTPEFNTLYISSYCLMGMAYNQIGEFEKSNEALKKFLEIGANSSVHTQLLPVANMLIGGNHMNLLQKEAERIKQSNPKEQVTMVADLTKKDKEAETYLLKAIELNPNLEEAYMHLGNYYYFCNDLDKTIEYYQKLVDKFPGANSISVYKSFLENRIKDKTLRENAAKEQAKEKKPAKGTKK